MYNYRGVSLREDTYDADLFLLQACASVMPADHYLAILMDRFELIPVLLPTPALQYETQQTAAILEDFLLLLIHLFCDRSKMGLLNAEQMTRQEVIQVLSTVSL